MRGGRSLSGGGKRFIFSPLLLNSPPVLGFQVGNGGNVLGFDSCVFKWEGTRMRERERGVLEEERHKQSA